MVSQLKSDNTITIEAPDRIRADSIFLLKRKWTLMTMQEEEICKYFLMKFKEIPYINWVFF